MLFSCVIIGKALPLHSKSEIMNNKSVTPIMICMVFAFILSCLFPCEAGAVEPRIRLIHDWQPGMIVQEKEVEQAGIDRCFVSQRIDDKVWNRMKGKSWNVGCPVGRDDLRYLRLLHYNAKGEIQTGEMVVNKAIAERVVNIFKQLYQQGYRIERIALIDNYNADDDRSMEDNNTSCFNYRKVAGTSSLSKHAYGLAIDLNPRYNPYVRNGKVSPENGKDYAYNRQKRNDIPYKIDTNDLAYRLFMKAGATWGGAWKTMKDYQHFQFAK